MPRKETSAAVDALLRKWRNDLVEFEAEHGVIGVIVDPPWNEPDMPGKNFQWAGDRWDEFDK